MSCVEGVSACVESACVEGVSAMYRYNVEGVWSVYTMLGLQYLGPACRYVL